MSPVDRTSLQRGRRVKYTKSGAIPAHDENITQVDFSESRQVVSGSQSGVRKRKGRGPGKLLASRPLKDRPEIWPVGKEEFGTTSTKPGQITSLITKLTLQNMPGPYISFLMFDDNTRLSLQKQFLVKSIPIVNL